MSLITEDGSGLSNAESYITLTEANTYHTAMGNADWTGTDDELEIALRKATQHIDAVYSFRGIRLSSDQALLLPTDYDSWANFQKALIPATAELALRALSADLLVDLSPDNIAEKTVGPITLKYNAQKNGGQTTYPLVEKLLKKYLLGGSGLLNVRLERAG